MIGRFSVFAWGVAFGLLSSTGASAEQGGRLLVMDIAHSAGDEETEQAQTITGLVTARIDEVTHFNTVSGDEIKNLVALKADEVAMGCDDTGCFAEVAGALGAQFVVFGRLSHLGEEIVLQLGLYDADLAEAVRRATIKAASIGEVSAKLNETIDALVGVDKEGPPTHLEEPQGAWLAPSIAAGGGAVLVVGGLLTGFTVPAVADKGNTLADREFAQVAARFGLVVGALGTLALAGGLASMIMEEL